MFVATTLVSAFLAVAIGWSAARKLSHDGDVVRSYARAGVPEDKLNALAAVLLVAAGGLVLGLRWPLIGIAAAAGLVMYFAVAVTFHIRHHDGANASMPTALALLAAAALALRLSTL